MSYVSLQINSYETCCCTVCATIGFNCHTARGDMLNFMFKKTSQSGASVSGLTRSCPALCIRQFPSAFLMVATNHYIQITERAPQHYHVSQTNSSQLPSTMQQRCTTWWSKKV